MIDVSIDIETLATTPDSIVFEIAACCEGFEFQAYLNFADQTDKRKFNTDTWLWHVKDHPELFMHQMNECVVNGSDTPFVLSRFINWFDNFNQQDFVVWMNSPSFDSVILHDLGKDFNFKIPWSHKQERDYRTLKAMAKVRNETKFLLLPDMQDNAHDALADAKYQLEIISQCKTILNC